MWLRADLTALVRSLESDPKQSEPVRESLTRWREEPDLACVRDQSELNKLACSPDERKEWLALWAEVAAVLARTKK
jgi:hypothetical protein